MKTVEAIYLGTGHMYEVLFIFFLELVCLYTITATRASVAKYSC